MATNVHMDIMPSCQGVALRRQRDGGRLRERGGELGEDRQVGVKSDPFDAPDAERE